MPIVRVNGTEIYHEIRGTGPPALLVMGATGDAGHFDKVAGLLADGSTCRSRGRPVPTRPIWITRLSWSRAIRPFLRQVSDGP